MRTTLNTSNLSDQIEYNGFTFYKKPFIFIWRNLVFLKREVKIIKKIFALIAFHVHTIIVHSFFKTKEMVNSYFQAGM